MYFEKERVVSKTGPEQERLLEKTGVEPSVCSAVSLKRDLLRFIDFPVIGDLEDDINELMFSYGKKVQPVWIMRLRKGEMTGTVLNITGS